MSTDKNTSTDNCDPELINFKPAAHRRLLNFLNEASSPEDLEYRKRSFIHDYEGAPVPGNVRAGLTVGRERILDHDTARKIIDFRHLKYPLGFRHLKELTGNGLLDSNRLDTLHHHFGEMQFGEWSRFPQTIPSRGPGTTEKLGVIHAALLHTGIVLFITADETTLLWDPEDMTTASFQDPGNQPHTMPEGYSQLCSHHVFLSDGRLLVVGGGGYGPHEAARWGYKFDPKEKYGRVLPTRCRSISGIPLQ